MFKELGAFVDEVGRSTGRVIKGLLSDKDDDGMMEGIIVHDPEIHIGECIEVKGKIVDGKIVYDEDDTNERKK